MSVLKQNMWRIVTVLAIMSLKISFVNSSEIQAFGYLGVEGQLNLDYLKEDNFSGLVDGDDNIIGQSTDTSQEVKQENLELLFHTFIYHPNFLKFDFGFGLVFTQNDVGTTEYTSDASVPPIITSLNKSRSQNNNSLDYNLRLSFFEKKTYPFSLYYVKKHPAVEAVTTDTLIAETVRYGANFLWNAPIKLSLDMNHFANQGANNLRVVDEQVDSSTISAYTSFINDGHLQLIYSHNIQKTKSGSILSERAVTKNTIDNVNLNNRYNFGNKREYTFDLNANYQQNRDSFEYDEIYVSPSLTWDHSDKLKSNYSYSFTRNIYSDLITDNQSLNAGISYFENQGISTRLDANAVQTAQEGSTSNTYGLINSTSYNHSFKHADFAVTMTLGVNESASVVGQALSPSNERLTMPKEQDFKELKQTNIDAGFFRVTSTTETDPNTKKLRIFDPAKDYEIQDRGNGKFAIGLRVKAPKLVAGHVVLIEYNIDNGSDNRYRNTLKGLTSTLGFFDYYNVFGGINQSDIKVLDGIVPKTLVTKRKVVYSGAGLDYPLIDNLLLIGAEVRTEQADEDLITTNSDYQIGYMQIQLFRGASLYLSQQKYDITYKGINTNNNNIDKLSYRALLKIQTTTRSNLSLVYDDSVDVGNITVQKKLTEISVHFDWTYRRILMRASGTKLRDLQGERLRERIAIQFNIVRTF